MKERWIECASEGQQFRARLYSMGERALVLDANDSGIIAGLSTAETEQHQLRVQRRLCWIAEKLKGRKGITEIVPGWNNLTVQYNPLQTKQQHWVETLCNHWEFADEHSFVQRHIDIAVRYGGAQGPDLAALAKQHQLSEQAVIDLHAGATYTVMFLGFQPGFAYLHGLPSAIHTARKTTPRTRVPAGSVAIGGAQTAIYPFESPGGWHIIGHTDLDLFKAEHDPCSALLPGDKVSFYAVDET